MLEHIDNIIKSCREYLHEYVKDEKIEKEQRIEIIFNYGYFFDNDYYLTRPDDVKYPNLYEFWESKVLGGDWFKKYETVKLERIYETIQEEVEDDELDEIILNEFVDFVLETKLNSFKYDW